MTLPVQPPPQSKKPSAWKAGGATILTFVALLYVIELVDQLTGHRLDDNGIRPLETDGLWGIVFAPLAWARLMPPICPGGSVACSWRCWRRHRPRCRCRPPFLQRR